METFKPPGAKRRDILFKTFFGPIKVRIAVNRDTMKNKSD